jgi:ATP-dependent RNA helicase RhlE
MTFKELGLSDALLKAIDKQGYTEPSAIQLKAIPEVLQGKDVLASAQTGTGKTAGFTLPLLQLLSKEAPEKRRRIRSLILTPTRELAAQIYENVQSYSEFLNIKSTVIFGGVNEKPQIRTLAQGVDILVATPGRLLDLESRGELSLKDVEILVLDEADRMLDMGFLRDIKRILKIVPVKRQTLLFSATFSADIKQLASSFLHNPVLVEATPQNTTAEKVIHKVYRTNKGKKTDLIIKLIKDNDWQQVLVFTRTKHGANKLCEKMTKAGISSSAIHGNKSQNARTKALASFKDGSTKILVATDIAARGLDIPLLPLVINFEIPNIPEDYVHRIGRTGRAGASGEALSLVSVDEMDYLRGIEKLLKERIKSEVIEGFEPTEKLSDIPSEPKRNFSRKPSGNKSGGFNRSKKPGGNNRPKSNSSRGGNR